MAERIYNKLVRDNIPDLIREQGETPIIHTLSDEEFLVCLKEKLREETEEFLKETTLDELSDVIEVLLALSEAMGWADVQVRRAQRDKAESRGAFRERIFLEKVLSEKAIEEE